MDDQVYNKARALLYQFDVVCESAGRLLEQEYDVSNPVRDLNTLIVRHVDDETANRINPRLEKCRDEIIVILIDRALEMELKYLSL